MSFTFEIGLNVYHALRLLAVLWAVVYLVREWWVVASVRGKRP